MPNLKQVKLGDNVYELSARYMHKADGSELTLEQIVAIHNIEIRVVDVLPTASAATMNAIYLVPSAKPVTENTKDEYITVREGTAAAPTYRWEKIGSTEIDLSNYVLKGTYAGTTDSQGAHTHTVTGTTKVPKVTKSRKKASVKKTQDVTLDTTNKDTFVKSVKASSTDNVLGVDTTFSTTVTPTTQKISAVASGATVGADGTASVISGFSTHTTATALGTNAAFSTSVTPTKTNIKATATGTALSSTTDEVLGAGTNFNVTGGTIEGATQASFTQGEFSQGTLPSFTQGARASWSAEVDVNGVLTFAFTANGDDVWSAGTLPTHTNDTFTPNQIGSVTGIGVTADSSDRVHAVDAVSVSTQPTISLSAVTSAGEGLVEVATGISSATTSVTSTDTVTAITALGTASMATVLTGVKVTAQPSIAISLGATGDADVVTAIAGATTSAVVTGTGSDVVTAVTGVGTDATAQALTAVSVATQPDFAIDDTTDTGIDFVQDITVETEDVALESGLASSNGAHTHTTSVVL